MYSQVYFDDFKDSFVTILCQTTVDEPLSEEDDSEGEEGSGAESEGPEEAEGETGQEEDAGRRHNHY